MTIPARIGRYRIVGLLARGETSEILLAHAKCHGGFERPVALKRLRAGVAHVGDCVRELLDEARVLGRLGHPNVVSLLDLDEVEGRYLLVLEHVDGSSVAAIMAAAEETGVAIPIDVAVTIAHGAALGVAHAHERGLAHRRLLPSNVLVAATGGVKLADFAPVPRERVDGESRTPEPLDAVDRGVDVHGLGLLLYQLSTGRSPYDRSQNVLRRILGDDVPPPSWARADYPRGLEPIVMAALERRLRSVEELVFALEAFAASSGFAPSPLRVAYFLRDLLAAREAAAPVRRAASQEGTAVRLARREVSQHIVPRRPEEVTGLTRVRVRRATGRRAG